MMREFTERELFNQRAREVFEGVLARNPATMMLVWEEVGQVLIATLPTSHAVAKGLTDTAYDIIWDTSDETDEEGWEDQD